MGFLFIGGNNYFAKLDTQFSNAIYQHFKTSMFIHFIIISLLIIFYHFQTLQLINLPKQLIRLF
jgi:hypothetical protein